MIQVPIGTEILSVQMQHDQPCMWALVDPEAKLFNIRILCYGTGWEVQDHVTGLNYLGTVQIDEGHEIYHFFRG